MQLARDAQASGDPVAAENYFQHAEHYFRVIASAQEQFRPNQPFIRADGGAADGRDDVYEDGEDEGYGAPAPGASEQPAFGTRDPQPILPRDAQFYPAREPSYGRTPAAGAGGNGQDEGLDRLPSFVTGSVSPSTPQAQPQQGQGFGANGSFEGAAPTGDRFPLHRRRRRHRTPRGDAPQGGAGDDGPPSPGDGSSEQ